MAILTSGRSHADDRAGLKPLPFEEKRHGHMHDRFSLNANLRLAVKCHG
jgi:hypothetical protein